MDKNSLGAINNQLNKKRVLLTSLFFNRQEDFLKITNELCSLELSLILAGVASSNNQARVESLSGPKVDTKGFFYISTDNPDIKITKNLTNYILGEISLVSLVIFYDNGLPKRLVNSICEISKNLSIPFIYVGENIPQNLNSSVTIVEREDMPGPLVQLKTKNDFKPDKQVFLMNGNCSIDKLVKEAVKTTLCGSEITDSQLFRNGHNN